MSSLAYAVGTLLFLGLASSGQAQDKPPLPYHDWGACPFECCMYREWVTKSPITAFKNRDEKSVVEFQLQKGERVLALTGVVVTHKFGVIEILRPIEVGYLPNSRKPMLSLKPKEVVYALHYAGEGQDLFWYKGKVYQDNIAAPVNAGGEMPNVAIVKILSRPAYDWWARIRSKTGKTGWTRETDKFGNQDKCGLPE